ncbi:molybdenum cofactor sulfurase [Cinnamomum micranthum f. kanehirae]|uniref:Molybdenum cofactor sulfurase n=1 Tax=Cinnamomum micranthum f. kanehirae TaxID=337451 RepID=A0A3S3MPV9_9MAGN|nr:molybdenum cofactor sulfurase [Cinnamomum micranthum f. kanehirae]
MQSPCMREASQACFHGCCPAPFLGLTEVSNPKPISSVAASRVNFINATASSLFPNSQFTNHESLPSLSEAFSSFTKAYPQYTETAECDHIRAHEYYHLSLFNRVLLMLNSLLLLLLLLPTLQLLLMHNSPSLRSPTSLQVLYGGEETAIESAIRKRIMGFLNTSEDDYRMVFTANGASAFKLLAESYMFQSNRRLLTVYDYESEAVSAMTESSQKRGAKVMSANFSWPSFRIHSAKLKKMVVGNRKKKKKGLFVFPLQSRMTGTRYPYLWMNLAQENGWHVLLDACALGPKDMDTLGLSLFQPDFLICSFYKVFGENPSGFGCLFVKKSSASVLEASTMARSIGIVNIVPARNPSQLPDDSSATDWETKQSKLQSHEDAAAMTSSFSGPLSGSMSNELSVKSMGSDDHQLEGTEHGETSELCEPKVKDKQKGLLSSEIVELENGNSTQLGKTDINASEMDQNLIECRGLDHADSVGLLLISSRVRFLINWLVFSLMKLRHPHSEKGNPLVRIYGPKVRFDRGPAVAFNVFDWKGEKVEPILVQKLADRSNISLGYGFLHNIWFSDKYEEDKEKVLEVKTYEVAIHGNKRKEKVASGMMVITASVGYLANFEDAYRLWAFIAKFLDADFVEKEKWRYMALNQKTVEV